ncbi:hypothetical protein Ssi03_14160 [Sphaerisporangium siamense]|uniref:Anti-sigma regulatory factor (Ser/Thr protein kinase) n=1 Tax=Sphaerisporangium siamense TaxID=795645 RepID=A0A7W7G9H4_9ACTN|nr:ATP-binding protein [Sphaerisporangium siamense]MBB4702818.1 anti-sigma regulatory factor (Ser/Thr protein kinase) [Sphaerisporangium siamense]GII83426.1 hypothetical protein Ssi03_14160 [Sphaerisporangium siamense]
MAVTRPPDQGDQADQADQAGEPGREGRGSLDHGRASPFAPLDESVRLGPELLMWRRAYLGRPDQVSQSRRFVRFLLGDTMFAIDAELIVGELAGNAVRHTRSGASGGHFTVEVTFTSARQRPLRSPAAAAGVLITVYDLGGGGVPRLGGEDLPGSPREVDGRDPAIEESGRGLTIVSALARRCGHQGGPVTGHRVWAYLSAPIDHGPLEWPTFDGGGAPVTREEITETICRNLAGR